MKDPIISIILPTYNGAEFIAQSIESCLEQTYPHWELIVVDDASRDDTRQIIARFEERDRRINLVRHWRNRRLPRSLNTGFRHARGEFLTWTSDDNQFAPNALEAMLHFLMKHETVDFVYCDYARIDSEGNVTELVEVAEPELLCEGNVVGACFLYRREVYEAVGDFDPRMFTTEDYEYWLRVSKQFKLARMNGLPLYYYRHHGTSLTTTHRALNRIQRARARAKHVLGNEEGRKLVARRYLAAARQAHDDRRLYLALQLYSMCIMEKGGKRRRAMAGFWDCLKKAVRRFPYQLWLAVAF